MFHNIPESIKQRMQYLEKTDANDRIDGTPRLHRLRQIPPETGKFLSLLASSSPVGDYIEIGTSAGYSSLWLYLAAKYRGVKIKTYELLPHKINLAKETFNMTATDNLIELYEGDAREYLDDLRPVAFCFLDTEKEIYETCYEKIKDKIMTGGFLVADNAINHYETIKPMIDKIMENKNFDSLVVPIGKGVLVSKRLL